jgi:hypothetical protein
MDYLEFFDARKIYYRTHGPNTSQGQCVIHCPWCGISDPSEHLSVSLTGKGFRCWRDPSHSGKSPVKLIQALLGCSWEEARGIAGYEKNLPSDFLGHLKGLMSKSVVRTKQELTLLPEFKKFEGQHSSKLYVRYLSDRDFYEDDANAYGIRYATSGWGQGRIIFPVYFQKELVGWTGRTIYPQEVARYKTLTNDPEKAKKQGVIPAPYPISHYLLFFDRLTEVYAHTIVLCEGPFDAWRVNVLGEDQGIVSTCFFTSTMSSEQLNLLHGLLPRFKERYILLDQGTFSKAERMRADLVALDVVVKMLPPKIKDPGDIPNTHMLKMCLQ